MRKLVQCEHCEGTKQCRSQGGKSCDQCLLASGRRPKDWATVRCSFCGGKGRLWVEEEEPPAPEAAEPTPEAAEPSPAAEEI